MVVTDWISAFDVVLPEGIPYKGQVLNQIAAKFLDATADILPNWKIAVPDPMVTVGRKCEPFKVEMVIRGYLSGHAWREYKAGKRTICGVEMPEHGREPALPRADHHPDLEGCGGPRRGHLEGADHLLGTGEPRRLRAARKLYAGNLPPR